MTENRRRRGSPANGRGRGGRDRSHPPNFDRRVPLQNVPIIPDPALASLLAVHAAAALYLMDPEGRVTWMNPAAVRMFGWSQEESLGQVLHDLVHYRDVEGRPFPLEACPLGGVMRSGSALLHHEDQFIHKDGHFVPVSCSNAPVRRDGNIVGAALVVHDISENRRAREEAERTRKRLDASERSLQQAYAAALAANRRKDEFLAILGHELRNPLAPIVTALELLRLRGAGFERELSTIDRQVQHLQRLVGDLLDVSRITQGTVRLQKQRVSLSDVVANAIELASPLFERQRHKLTVSLAKHALVVDGDAQRLSQVISNLLSNAAKYTPQGGQVTLTTRLEGADAVVEVKDNGVGMAEELLPYVFDLFVQSERTLDRAQGGLGLGLALVKSLVELHGGQVSAESGGAGRGSTFRVRLPLANASATVGAAPSPGDADGAGTTELAGARVLIVDDNEDAADLLAILLGQMGMPTRTAHDGPSALTIVNDFTPDIAILDLGLPVMDGYELARNLRLRPGLESLRTIALTGYGTEQDRKRSRTEGFDAHLTKPVEVESLVSVIGEFVRAAGDRA